MSSDYPNLLTAILPVNPNPVELPLYYEPLEIIAQPYYTSKLRYRSDYEKYKTRRGVLHSQNNPNYHYPAIRIPQIYLDLTQQYYIRVCLVTIENEQTKCRYIHPYELEDIDSNDHNDRKNRVVWFPIQAGDIDGIKSFSSLRIVKTKADHLKNHGDFLVFGSPHSFPTPQLSSVKDIIKEFNLNKSQLAFTIGKKIIGNDNVTYFEDYATTFSEELIEIFSRESDLPSESTTVSSHSSKSLDCRMYKYAPRIGYTDSNDEILIFFTNKLKPKKYGDLQVTFEYDAPNIHWSKPVLDLEVIDQMVSFRTPNFPFPIDSCTTVNVILKQKKRDLEPLKFDYFPIVQCPQCQRNARSNPNPVIQTNRNPVIQTNRNPVIQTNPNKRPRSTLYADDEESDGMMLICENNSENQESNPEPGASSSSTPMHSGPSSSINEDPSEQILNKLADSIASLFSNQDFKPVLRICRPFIRKRPELLHEAIRKNSSDLISNFISVAGIELLQEKNQLGETILLHAARLNRVNIVEAILRKENSDRLLEDTNNKGQNVFHILALNTDSDEILNLFINHLLKNLINISEKFDHVDENNQTPLQLAIKNNNLPARHLISKYFHNDIHDTIDHITDAVIQLTVFYDDLTKVK